LTAELVTSSTVGDFRFWSEFDESGANPTTFEFMYNFNVVVG
jgi:hypothetical protein